MEANDDRLRLEVLYYLHDDTEFFNLEVAARRHNSAKARRKDHRFIDLAALNKVREVFRNFRKGSKKDTQEAYNQHIAEVDGKQIHGVQIRLARDFFLEHPHEAKLLTEALETLHETTAEAASRLTILCIERIQKCREKRAELIDLQIRQASQVTRRD